MNIRALADHVGRVAEATLFAKHDHFYRSPFDAYNDAQHNRHMQRVHVELALLQVYLPASDHRERSWVLRDRGDTEMTETVAYPYATYLDVKFDPLTLIDVSLLARTVTDQWYNQTLCKVNESVIRLGVMQGEYHWHKHDNDDEFFFVLSGRFIIDLEGHSIELLPNQGFTVPKGVLHCTRAPERSVILMVETAAIVPTGDT